MRRIDRLLYFLDAAYTRLHYQYGFVEDCVLFPLAYWLHRVRNRELEDMHIKLRCALYRFQAHKPLHYTDYEHVRRWRANMDFRNLEILPDKKKDRKIH